MSDEIGSITARLKGAGFVRLKGPQTLSLLGQPTRASWDSFARSWDNLSEDLYMADGGRYRRRRHAAFGHAEGILTRKPHQPHYQSREHNRLNGDVQRWFEPVLPVTVEHSITKAILDGCLSIFSRADALPTRPWHIEFHQFRIETSPQHVGRPTPEGMHRDGVDWVFVMLVQRQNVRDGMTEIGSPEGRALGSFTLQDPGDAVLLDDRRILHSVTEIHAIDPALQSFRDVLVVTFVR